jgi:membrane associated rhomboid family serine protease
VGIYDRDYIRQEEGKAARLNAQSTPAVYILLAVTGLVVFLEVFGNTRYERSPFFLGCSFSLAKFQSGEIWRAATYPIVCEHPMTYLYELCVLLIFGRPYERRFGARWLLGTYFGSATAAALGVWGFANIGMLAGIDPQDGFSGPTTALLGLLGAVFFTIGRSMTELHLPNPTNFELRWAALAASIIGLLAIADAYWQPHQRFIAVFGLFAGMAIGKSASLLSERRRSDVARPRWSSRRRDDEPIVVKFPAGKAVATEDNVDDLLAKISEHGIDSLEQTERDRLNAASAKRRQNREG